MRNSQAPEKRCLASGISVKNENYVMGEIFQDAHLLVAQFSSQKADGIFETRLMESQNIEITFDHKNSVVRDSELFQAEQNLPLVEGGGIMRVYVLWVRRAIGSPATESDSGGSRVGERKNYSAYEGAGYLFFFLL